MEISLEEFIKKNKLGLQLRSESSKTCIYRDGELINTVEETRYSYTILPPQNWKTISVEFLLRSCAKHNVMRLTAACGNTAQEARERCIAQIRNAVLILQGPGGDTRITVPRELI